MPVQIRFYSTLCFSAVDKDVILVEGTLIVAESAFSFNQLIPGDKYSCVPHNRENGTFRISSTVLLEMLAEQKKVSGLFDDTISTVDNFSVLFCFPGMLHLHTLDLYDTLLMEKSCVQVMPSLSKRYIHLHTIATESGAISIYG